MSSTWLGLSTALSSLRTQRVAIDVTGQNIANVNTPGYARQRVSLSAGTGVDVTAIQRLHSAILGGRARIEEAQLQDFTVASAALKEIEQVFAEPSANGLQARLDAMWDGFADIARDPTNRAARIQVLSQAGDVASWLNGASAQLTDIATTQRDSLTTLIATVNQQAEQIADLNVSISQSVEGTPAANALLDQRNQLASQIAKEVGGTFTVDAANRMSISLGGGTLVSPTSYQTLKVSTAGGTTSIQWEHDSSTATVSAGEANARLTTINETIGDWRGQLDAVASTLVAKVNALQTTGYDLAGDLGTAFFTVGGTTAATISVALTDGTKIGASSFAKIGGVASLDGSKADAIAQLAMATDGADQAYQDLVVSLGLSVQSAEQTASTQQAMTLSITSQIDAESGVNIDEEMANLLTYQRAYEAAARVLSAIDSVLDTLVNRTGIVGR